MYNIVFVFAGTGENFTDPSDPSWFAHDYLNSGKDIIIKINGCHNIGVGHNDESYLQKFGVGLAHVGILSMTLLMDGNKFFPDLSIIVSKVLQYIFNRYHFNMSELSLSLRNDKNKVFAEYSKPDEVSCSQLIQISSITLVGFSRGGITSFLLAKELYKLCPQIPVYIFASQPVPGSTRVARLLNPRSMAKGCLDLSECTNVKLCHIALGNIDKSAVPWYEEYLYTQIVPRFNSSTGVTIHSLPIKSHFEGKELIRYVSIHFLSEIKDKYPHLHVTDSSKDYNYLEKIAELSTNNRQTGDYYYCSMANRQNIFHSVGFEYNKQPNITVKDYRSLFPAK
tara:strand:- start:195 stop:1208 length:1014 start_codon:yes stop_codon:yes gene_type:complete